jgi:hypothetical protein
MAKIYDDYERVLNVGGGDATALGQRPPVVNAMTTGAQHLCDYLIDQLVSLRSTHPNDVRRYAVDYYIMFISLLQKLHPQASVRIRLMRSPLLHEALKVCY